MKLVDDYHDYLQLIFDGKKLRFDLLKMILMSWPFMLISTVVNMALSISIIDQVLNLFPEMQFYFSQTGHFDFVTQSTLSSVVGVLFYPLWMLAGYLFWHYYLRFVHWQTGAPSDQKKIDKLVLPTMAAHFFLVLPFIGSTVSWIVRYFILGRELHRQSRFSIFQSILILILPYFVIFLCLMSLSFLIFGFVSLAGAGS